MINKVASYWKFVVAVIGAIVSWAGLVIQSPEAAISSAEWYVLVVGVSTALGVYQARNGARD